MNKVLELNSADYKFIDWLNVYQYKIPSEFFGEEWFSKAKKLKSFIEENSLQESVTFSDPRLIGVAFEMMMRIKKGMQSRLINWFIVKEYLKTYEAEGNEAIDTYRDWVDSYMGYNFTDARPDEETLADYNSKAEYILQSGLENIIPEFVKDELSANVYVEEFEEEDNTLLIEVANIMLKYAKGSVKKEWQSFLDSLSSKFARGGEFNKFMRGGIAGDIYSLQNPEQFKQLITIYNDLSEKTNLIKNYYLDHTDNSMVILTTPNISDIGKDEIYEYVESLRSKGFSIINFKKTINTEKYRHGLSWGTEKDAMIEQTGMSGRANPQWFKLFLIDRIKYAHGGNAESENRQMVLNQNKQIKHHTEELPSAVKKAHHVPAWVVAKVNRSANDISDATHYLDGENEEYANGGSIEAKYKKMGYTLKKEGDHYTGIYNNSGKRVGDVRNEELENTLNYIKKTNKFYGELNIPKLATGGNMINKWFKN
jgi:hypothetical protein